MAWDFQTDPEFQKKLDWAKEFVADELIHQRGLPHIWTTDQRDKTGAKPLRRSA